MDPKNILVDEQFLPAALDLILKAQKSIWIATFKAELTSKPRGRKLVKFFYTLQSKARKGIDIRFIINKTVSRGHIPLSNTYAINWLRNNGIKVHYLQDERVCHAKVLIVDSLTAISGSHNLSVKSCHNNFEVSYIIQGGAEVETLCTLFERMWENSRNA